MDKFKQFLLSKNSIKSKYIPYYIKWIIDCYSYLEVSLSHQLNNNQKNQFLTYMAKKHEDWQINQADTALRLYQYFLSNEVKSTLNIEKIGDWNEIEKSYAQLLGYAIGHIAQKRLTLHGCAALEVL